MKVHEYQAKEILKKYGVPVQDGVVIEQASEGEGALDQVERQFGATQFVIKAQIHAGGRGKGGGVKFSPTREKALENIRNILGMTLVTHQTGPQGQFVRKVMVGEAVDIEKEFYVAITLDRSKAKNVLMASTEGGMDIEEVAAHHPEKIVRETIDPITGLLGFQVRRLVKAFGFTGDTAKEAGAFFRALVKAYLETDAAILEVNPLVLTKQGKLVALDAKLNLDDNALYRHPDLAALRDEHEEDPMDVEASKSNLNFIKLGGNVGCMVNGAGLAMSTMDVISLHGGMPANFLDVGGGANVNTVKNAFRLLQSDPSVKAILVNIFGGIVRCDRVANGIVQAVGEVGLKLPLVVRLQGTNADLAKKILKESGLAITPAETLTDAAKAAVSLAGKA